MARNKIIPYRKDLKQKARDLRKHSTLSEVLFWYEIKNRRILGYQFHRQVPMLDYIVDFYCHELMLAIEIDGNSHEHALAVDYDRERQSRLEKEGVHFLRFDDVDVKQNISYVVVDIIHWIESNVGKYPPQPPSREEFCVIDVATCKHDRYCFYERSARCIISPKRFSRVGKLIETLVADLVDS